MRFIKSTTNCPQRESIIFLFEEGEKALKDYYNDVLLTDRSYQFSKLQRGLPNSG